MAGDEQKDDAVTSDNSALADRQSGPSGFDASTLQSPELRDAGGNQQLDKHNFSSVSDLASFAKTSLWNSGPNDGTAKEAASLSKQMPFNQKSLVRSA